MSHGDSQSGVAPGRRSGARVGAAGARPRCCFVPLFSPCVVHVRTSVDVHLDSCDRAQAVSFKTVTQITSLFFLSHLFSSLCGGVEDVVSVLNLVRRGVAQVFHVLRVEEHREQLEVEEEEERKENRQEEGERRGSSQRETTTAHMDDMEMR